MNCSDPASIRPVIQCFATRLRPIVPDDWSQQVYATANCSNTCMTRSPGSDVSTSTRRRFAREVLHQRESVKPSPPRGASLTKSVADVMVENLKTRVHRSQVLRAGRTFLCVRGCRGSGVVRTAATGVFLSSGSYHSRSRALRQRPREECRCRTAFRLVVEVGGFDRT